MRQRGLVLAGWVTLVLTSATAAEGRQLPPNLSSLADMLGLKGRGIERWLNRLGASVSEPAERLLAVNLEGEALVERNGQGSSVRVDPELDGLLHRPERSIVLVHNHPASIGLSAEDLRQVGKPGVVAIVAIGHDRSVFIASAGARMQPDVFAERQYAPAREEVLRRLRTEWPSGSVSVPIGEAHFSHLVTLTLARAGIVKYWFHLRGEGCRTYFEARMAFGRVVTGAAERFTQER